METGTKSKSIGVMQLTDSLEAGGMERVAVNLANNLPPGRYRSYLCTTRQEGPLAQLVDPQVARLRLYRKGKYRIGFLAPLADYVRRNRIQILHAHGTSVFVAAIASMFRPHPAVIWHDHFGAFGLEQRPAWVYRLAAKRLHGVIAVTQALVEWAKVDLHMPGHRVWYIRNFVDEPKRRGPAVGLPGAAGSRIVCVANLRPQKDQITLLKAMRIVVGEVPSAHLLLVGEANDSSYQSWIQREMGLDGLEGHVSWLGPRDDVPAILEACDIGVLSSASEGLPLSLIEYGMAGLPAVATRVGQCEEVLDYGRVGILVPPSLPEPLAEQMIALLRSPEKRAESGQLFLRHVRQLYSMERGVKQICEIYEGIIGERPELGI